MLNEGFVIKKTTLSDEFDYEDFRRMYGDAAVVLFLIEDRKNLRVCAADEPISPKSGNTLLALVPGTNAAASR
jgi:hypothetical protein